MTDTITDSAAPASTAELRRLCERLGGARVPEDVFGPLTGDLAAQRAELRRMFHALARVAHPDYSAGEPALAHDAFRRLAQWRADAERALENRTYGTGAAPLTLRLATGAYEVEGALAATALYAVRAVRAGAPVPAERLVVKSVHDPRDNAFARRDIRVLRELAQADPQVGRYLPRVIESFIWSDGMRKRQSLIVAEPVPLHTLQDVRDAFPSGLDPRDAAWMFNRLLELLWLAHRQGVVHGAVLPPNLSVHLPEHGLMAGDWSLSVGAGAPLAAIPADYSAWYPPEILRRMPATFGTDLFLAARCLVYLLGGDPLTGQLPAGIPGALQRFIRGCLLPVPARRPADAGALREEFGDLLKHLYGPPVFRPLTTPT